MAEITDPVVIATIVQTIVITLTLVIFILQFRSQERAVRESSYQSLLGRYNDYVMSSGEGDDALLARVLTQESVDLKDGEAPQIRRLMIAYGIIEEAYELYKKGWIDEETWEQWGAWLAAISRHPRFRTLHTMTTGMFDKDFQKHVTDMLESNAREQRN